MVVDLIFSGSGPPGLRFHRVLKLRRMFLMFFSCMWMSHGCGFGLRFRRLRAFVEARGDYS